MFKRIEAQNLFSWEDLSYTVPTGISQITGWNYDDKTSEGSGKSSILNAFCWALYGKVPQDVNIAEIIRKGEKSCAAVVELENGYLVHRTRGPNALTIYTPDGTPQKGTSLTETQNMIDALVGMNFDVFCQSIYIAQDHPRRFISASATEKAAILSEIQQLDLFDLARAEVMKRLKTLSKELAVDEGELRAQQSLLAADVQASTHTLRMISEFNAKKASKIKQLEDQLATVPAIETLPEVPIYEDDEAALVEIRVALGGLQAENKARDLAIAQAQRAVAQQHALVAALRAEVAILKQDQCPTCAQPVNADKHVHLKTQRNEALAVAEASLAQYEAQLQAAQAKNIHSITELQEAQALATANIQAGKAVKAQAEQLAKRNNATIMTMRTLQVQLDAAQQENCDSMIAHANSLAEPIQRRRETIPAQEQTVREKQKLILQLETLASGFKDIKSYIFKDFLNILSKEASNLARQLFEVPITVQFFSEDGISKIETRIVFGDAERSLGLFSGGQSKRIQLAVDLALGKILANRANNPIQLRFLDEPFKNLSAESIEKVMQILQEQNITTVIVDHSDTIKQAVHTAYHVELKNGISYGSNSDVAL